ncbi:MAG: primosomal protein N' [Planctomycetes bacterium]|nr:primosomal protein N' [Planctomycetota bacterium]
MSQLFDTSPAGLTGRFAHVALERGIDAPEGLTYAIPEVLADLRVGERVVVPLGRGDRPVSGYVVGLTDKGDFKYIKPVTSRDAGAISLTPDLIALAQWMAGYYCAPIGMVFATMLPAAVKRGTGVVRRTMVSLSPGTGAAAPPVKSKAQRAVLDTAAAMAGRGEVWVEMKVLADRAGAKSVSPVKHLVDAGLLVARQEERVFAEWEGEIEASPAMSLTLNEAQSRAVDRLAASVERGFSVHLLYGVTGSGKTEVYLRAIERVMGRDNCGGADRPGVIVLVPEIALTPQTVSRFTGRFGGVAVLHSGLTASQRHEQWRRIRAGEANIVVGARSAIFAPLPRLGLIIVDEEHENSYKQDQLPRYHARDVAIRRAHLAAVPVMLGSATPSLESYHNATGVGVAAEGTSPSPRQHWHLQQLPERVTGLKLPRVEIVDLAQEQRKRYEMTGRGGVHLLSVRLEINLRSTLESKGQAMLLLNRRGYANYIACPDHRCGWMMACDHCDATMVYHKDAALPLGGVVRCHHCTAEQILPAHCPTCGKKVTVFGLGTQRVEEEIARKFPGARLLRMDSDVMRTGRDYHRSLEMFRRGEVDVLVGTQMIAKGLDFPNVRLVGVIAADTALHIPDFRAAERTFQLVAQVAGRAGRGEHASLVIVQSFNPADPAIEAASRHDYEGFAARELSLRAEMGLPPISRMARIVVRDRDLAVCTGEARKLADHLEAFNTQLKLNVRLRGPMPCPIARIGDYHRQQVELIAPPPEPAATLQRLLTALRNARVLRSDAHMAVDVDPVSLL